MIAEKRKLFFSFSFLTVCICIHMPDERGAGPLVLYDLASHTGIIAKYKYTATSL